MFYESGLFRSDSGEQGTATETSYFFVFGAVFTNINGGIWL